MSRKRDNQSTCVDDNGSVDHDAAPSKKAKLGEDPLIKGMFGEGSGDAEGGDFSFAFGQDASEDENGMETDVRIPLSRLAEYAVVRSNLSGTGNFSVQAGDVVRIDWEASTIFRLAIEKLHVEGAASSGTNCMTATYTPTGIRGSVPPSCVFFPPTEEAKNGLYVMQATDNARVLFLDAVWEKTSKITRHPHISSTPLVIEPGLASYCWPLSPAEFLQTVFQKRSFVVHGTASRLSQMRSDFHDFDVKKMIQHCSRSVVWMKTVDGKVQYIDASPDVSLNCYNAGHSLYFNPEIDVQEKYIQELCVDLGLNFGLEKDNGFGGDIEIFAVRGKHSTPWHIDAQENFSIQLKGTKRWHVAPSSISDPVTNLHALSTNVESVANDRKVHRSYTDAGLPPDEYTDVASFTLRPGSVLYVPGGAWHRVDSEAEEGSLSLNFSIDTSRWSELFVNRILPYMWSLKGWRERIQVSDHDHARQFLQSMLEDLADRLQNNVNARDFLPEALFRECRLPSVVEVNGVEKVCETLDVGEGYEKLKNTKLCKSPLTSYGMEAHDCKEGFCHLKVNAGFGNASFLSDVSTVLSFPLVYRPQVEAMLAAVSQSGTAGILGNDLLASVLGGGASAESESPHIHQLITDIIGLCLHLGLFKPVV